MSSPENVSVLIGKLRAIAAAGGPPVLNDVAQAFAECLTVLDQQSQLITELKEEIIQLRTMGQYSGRLQ